MSLFGKGGHPKTKNQKRNKISLQFAQVLNIQELQSQVWELLRMINSRRIPNNVHAVRRGSSKCAQEPKSASNKCQSCFNNMFSGLMSLLDERQDFYKGKHSNSPLKNDKEHSRGHEIRQVFKV